MNRWLVKRGLYTFDRRIFLGAIGVLTILWLVIILQIGTGSHYRISCPANAIAPCKNPYYTNEGLGSYCIAKDPELCQFPRILNPGESYGDSPPFIVEYFEWIVLLIIVAAFGINHAIHNKRFDLWNKLYSKH